MTRKNLITKIHIAKNELGLDDETYRALLRQTTQKASCTQMNMAELKQALKAFEDKGFKVKSKNKRRQSPLSKGLEIDRIRAIWITMGNQGFINDSSESALDAYVRRMTDKRESKVDATAWLKGDNTRAVHESLKRWHKRVMAEKLVSTGITQLSSSNRQWSTAYAPYNYVRAAYEGQFS